LPRQSNVARHPGLRMRFCFRENAPLLNLLCYLVGLLKRCQWMLSRDMRK
jgi:hypothetical protein